MKITQVEPQKNNPGRFNVYLDGNFAFGASEDLVVNLKLVPGKNIDNAQLKKLLDDTEVDKLLGKLYRWFGIRMRSEKETRDYLKRKKTDIVLVENLVNRLKDRGLINDFEFAKLWISARRSSKKQGIFRIKSELLQKGISKDIVDEAVSSKTDCNEDIISRQAIEKKLKTWQKLPDVEFKRKAYGFLLRKGFAYAVVQRTVDYLMNKLYNNL